MEVFGVPVNGPNVALTGAGLLAFWQFIGSKIPWGALLEKLLALITRKKDSPRVADISQYVVGFSEQDPASDVMAAICALHENATDSEAHAKISAVEADYWQKRKQPTLLQNVVERPTGPSYG